MAARIQQLILGLGLAKQSNISTVGASFLRFKKIDTAVTSAKPMFENDAAEIGKGNEFIGATFPSHWEIANRIEKYASAEFMTWVLAYALGNNTITGTTPNFINTIVPIDPGTTLELPYFSVVEQVPEGGGSAIDNVYIGCAIEDFVYSFNSGPGRASSKVSVNWVGSGQLTSPSTITVPAVQSEKNMLAASMALTINGIDYVAAKTILSGSVGWKNNLLVKDGFFPGSGEQSGLQIAGRLEIGARVPSFQFTVRLLHTSTEYALLVAQTAGSATLTISFDANNSLALTWPQLAFQMVENVDADGLVAVTVTGAPEWNGTSVFSAVCKCGITGIAN